MTPSDSQRWHLNSARQIRNTSVLTCATPTPAIACAVLCAVRDEASRILMTTAQKSRTPRRARRRQRRRNLSSSSSPLKRARVPVLYTAPSHVFASGAVFIFAYILRLSRI